VRVRQWRPTDVGRAVCRRAPCKSADASPRARLGGRISTVAGCAPPPAPPPRARAPNPQPPARRRPSTDLATVPPCTRPHLSFSARLSRFPAMRVSPCSFCSVSVYPGRGTMFVRNDSKVRPLCSGSSQLRGHLPDLRPVRLLPVLPLLHVKVSGLASALDCRCETLADGSTSSHPADATRTSSACQPRLARLTALVALPSLTALSAAHAFTLRMKRNPRKVRWTKSFRKASGKEMTIVSPSSSLPPRLDPPGPSMAAADRCALSSATSRTRRSSSRSGATSPSGTTATSSRRRSRRSGVCPRSVPSGRRPSGRTGPSHPLVGCLGGCHFRRSSPRLT
jgi:ribosomal protein L24E